MATFTASTWHLQPRQPHSGVQAAVFRYSSGHDPITGAVRIGSVGDRILLARIPAWVDVLHLAARVRTRNEDADAHMVLMLNRSSLSATLATISTFSSSEALGRIRVEPTVQFAPFRLSMTAVEQYASVCLQWLPTSQASATVSFSIDGHILFQTGSVDDKNRQP